MRRMRASVLLLWGVFGGCAATHGTSEGGLERALADDASKAPDPRPVLVTFVKPGCPACLRLEPVLAEIRKEYEAGIRFVEVDIHEAPQLIMQYEITATPTLILFADRKEVERLVNPREPELRKALDAAKAGGGA